MAATVPSSIIFSCRFPIDLASVRQDLLDPYKWLLSIPSRDERKVNVLMRPLPTISQPLHERHPRHPTREPRSHRSDMVGQPIVKRHCRLSRALTFPLHEATIVSHILVFHEASTQLLEDLLHHHATLNRPRCQACQSVNPNESR